ncbi:MAG: sugar transferase [Bradymonadales bacterium]|nr:sugar transferase [Bradymonadales bacterium]
MKRPFPTKKLELAIKRLFDVTSCSVIASAGLPLFALIAALVRLSSPGPIFFTQTRAGYKGRPFKMVKFRTMVHRPDHLQPTTWTRSEEEAITRIGSLLRDYGLDELPQVINILKGEMSVIGPRPLLPEQVAEFDPVQRRMLDMKPGVLSLAAIKGRRAIPPEQRIAYQVEYVDRWSLLLDLQILYQALWVVLQRRDARELSCSEKPAR